MSSGAHRGQTPYQNFAAWRPPADELAEPDLGVCYRSLLPIGIGGFPR